VYLLRAVKGAEGVGNGNEMIPLRGLCDLYDRGDKPDKGQACWHRVTELMAVQYGENSPKLTESLGSEAKALRKLGRADEAEKVEERIAKIHQTSESRSFLSSVFLKNQPHLSTRRGAQNGVSG